MWESFKDEFPVFQQPVGLGAAIAQVFLRKLMKFPLHIKCAHGFAVLEADDPALSGIARYVASALNRVCQH